ncbi:MAG: DEAD/DEAH box helicase [Dehalococcoidia bacterium]|nr:DEAD/DEAH box helicase [Dehalococcoidia bacterium]
MSASPLEGFHPAVRAWFEHRFGAPTDAQAEGWPRIRAREDVLVSAPTGSGKTMAAFLAGIDELLQQAAHGTLEDGTAIVYVSPLKALGNDIQRNLEGPLAEIVEVAAGLGMALPELRTGVRTGDTPSSERAAMVRRPPHILITTPESLYLLLTSERGRETLRHVRSVIVDEIHSLARDRRGSHLTLSLERLDHVVTDVERGGLGVRPQRIGLSATVRPIEEIAAFLGGRGAEGDRPLPAIVDLGHQRDLELAVEVPPTELEAVMTAEQWSEVYDRLAELIAAHHTTLVFVNTRRTAERVQHHLETRLGADGVASHHGSLSKERRLRVEQQLKNGELRALVATASLELGIDIGSIDLVCQVGSPGSIAAFLQRVGRSGHALGLRPSGRLFPTTRDELVECAALVRGVRAGRLDRVVQPRAPLDVLAQHVVAEASCEDWDERALLDLVRGAAPFADLATRDYEEVLAVLGEGVGEGAGRARPLLHRDRINGVLRARRGSRLLALTNGGTIPEMGDYRVIADPDETFVGTVNEDFAMESMIGDVFLLGSTSWRIAHVENGNGVVRVVDANGAAPSIPFWLGEAPGRTIELSEEVGALRRDVAGRLEAGADLELIASDLAAPCGLEAWGAAQIVDYLRATRDALGIVPSDTDVVFERFFDETGGMQLVVHAPFGARINRAWGLALRKRFCVTFDFELQAAASDDSILMSLGPQHSFPLEDSFAYVTPENATAAVEQSVLYVPLFGTRFRWVTTRALAVPRQRGGRKLPPFLQRRIADDLLAAVFPEQVGCQENVTGPLELPDHPYVRQAMRDCLHEAMNVEALLDVLERIDDGRIRLHARDTTEPSPMAHEIVTGKPFTYLDNAPIEERRTRAVQLRRSLPSDARDLGQLDEAAIALVREQAWPVPRDAEEVHDALVSLVALRAAEIEGTEGSHDHLEVLRGTGRAGRVAVGATTMWFATESLPAIDLLYPGGSFLERPPLPAGIGLQVADREEARRLLLRGHAEALGPVTVGELAVRTALEERDVTWGLQQLEAGGFVLRGRFSPGAALEEWCDRRLLARIHRLTLDRLRREIDPVSAQDFMRFLLRWQHLGTGRALLGKPGVRAVIEQLQGVEAPASEWESDLLPARVNDYSPGFLDELSLGGEVVWGRLAPRIGLAEGATAAAATRATPITLAPRAHLGTLLALSRAGLEVRPPTRGAAAEAYELLRDRGALFFEEIVAATRRLPGDVERGLRELVAAGLVTADGFQGLRQVAGSPNGKGRRQVARRGHRPGLLGGLAVGPSPAGRWALLGAPMVLVDAEEQAEAVAELLLRRYGVVIRELALREAFAVPWRDVLRALRRMEARGTARGGRFIAGFMGEQYALPEAVDMLRRVRREPRDGERIALSACDPLNLTGVLFPGARVPSIPGREVVYLDGAPLLEAVPSPTDSRVSGVTEVSQAGAAPPQR